MAKVNNGPVTGTPDSWESVILRYYHKLMQYAYRLTGDMAEAEDIVQEATYRVLRTEITPIELQSAYAYLHRSVKNAFVDKLKKERVGEHLSLDEQKGLLDELVVVSPSDTIENDIYYKELLASLPKSILFGGLSEYEIKLLFMDAVEEMNPNEIAAALGEDADRIRYHLNRLYARIRYRVRKLMK
jgi:RNA polymerase sigma-70 factor (ECF subfamily)